MANFNMQEEQSLQIGGELDRLAQCVKLAMLDGAPQLINGYAVWLGGIFYPSPSSVALSQICVTYLIV